MLHSTREQRIAHADQLLANYHTHRALAEKAAKRANVLLGALYASAAIGLILAFALPAYLSSIGL